MTTPNTSKRHKVKYKLSGLRTPSMGLNLRLTPLAYAVTTLLVAGSFATPAQAQQAFSGAWFAAKGAVQQTAVQTGRLPNGMPVSSLMSPLGQQQKANEQLQRSISNLNLAARGIAAQQSAQAAARLAATNDPSVPNGMTEGGLKIDTNSLTAGWINANAPVQTVADGKTNVAIQQTADKAILNWETFNVGRNTTVDFKQNADWVVLNRVNDPLARPSQIQGQIKADGTVMIVNRNGVIFDGTSQVNTRNLVAAAANITDTQFTTNGLYGVNANMPSFTDAYGKIEVKAGAAITTHEPTSVTQGGGYVLLAGSEVHNAGEITTRKGQTQLAAGDSFVIRKGVGTDGNTASTTRGNEISPQFVADSTAGKVSNTGLLLAREGDITLAGRDVRQEGVAVSTTTVNQRGTVHLLNSASDTLGKVTLGKNALTAILIENDGKTTALDSQRDALIKDSAAQDLLRADSNAGAFDNYSKLADRRDQSRIEFVSGGNVVFEGESLTLATGGQIVADARGRSFVADKAQLDVSGAVGVNLAMESNNVQVNVQGNELRDSPLNRDSGKLANSNIWIDRRQLILVPAGTDGYESDRWYAAGGLLEVGGYLGNQGHSIGEWAAQGGTVTLAGKEVITQAGSHVNLAGGTLDVATGYVFTTWLKGSDGLQYTVKDAPADMMFVGVYKGFEDEHARWGKNTTAYFYNPLIAPQRRLESGYTVGRDAGRLIVSAPTALLEGDIEAKVFNGVQQSKARASGRTDGYKQAQNAVARPGTLALLGLYLPAAGDYVSPYTTDVRFGEFEQATRALVADTVLAQDRIGTAWLDSQHVNAQGLGGLQVATGRKITISKALALAAGGVIDLTASAVDIGADLVARGGVVTALATAVDNAQAGYLTLRSGATIDTRGLWTNAHLDASDLAGLAYINGGSVTLRAAGDVTLEAGSLIDASAGGAVLADRSTRGGNGGDIALRSSMVDLLGNGQSGIIALNGDIRSYGFTRGGKLTLHTDGIMVIDDPKFDLGTSLPAGTVLPLDVTLAEGMVIPAGTPIPNAYQATITKINPGTKLTFLAAISEHKLQADWIVPQGISSVNWYRLNDDNVWVGGGFAYPGQTISKGAILQQGTGLPIGYTVPADAFPNGVGLYYPIIVNYAAGSILTSDLALAAGTVLPQGMALLTAISIEEVRRVHLNSNLFDSGFSSYTLNGQKGLIVGDGAHIAPVMPLLRLNGGSAQVPTGSDARNAADLYLAPVYSEDPTKARLTQRAGVDLDLRSGIEDSSNPGVIVNGWVSLGKGAAIEVDPGHSVRVASGGQISIDGSITAHGGNITIVNQRPLGGMLGAQATDPGALSVWIGGNAVLDTSAKSYTALDAVGRAYGVVPDGGNIVLGHEGSGSTDAMVVIRTGASLNASGTSASIDPSASARPVGVGAGTSAAQTFASRGGSIALNSYNGLYLDGALRAASGGEGAAGGSLSVMLESPVYSYPNGESSAYVAERLRAGRVITVSQDTAGSGLTAGLAPGQSDPVLQTVQARISVRQVAEGGFDTLSLWGRDGIAFDGDVSLNVGRSLSLLQGPIYNTVAGGSVVLSTPYLLLDGRTTVPVGRNQYLPDVLPTYPSGGTLTANADLIDIRNTVKTFYDKTQLLSRSDLRFLASTDVPVGGVPTTRLTASADLTLTAQQLYPTTWAVAEVTAGAVAGANPSKLSIKSIDGSLPPMPHSMFGAITFGADVVEQGGIVRAPLGNITLGTENVTKQVVLLPDSLTSVSANGLVMPYGGTTDGIRYAVDGQEAVALNLIDGKFTKPGRYDAQGIVLNGIDIISQEGSKLDLSGGGTLAGAAFVSGRGGSVDALLNPLTHGGKVYAIIPGVATAPVAGGDAEAWKGDVPGIGEQITIPAGVPGLAAGTYTLLPANYALLPGAYRVELGARSLVAQVPAPMLMPNGSYALSGVRSVANTAIRDASTTAVTVTPGAVLRTYAQYNEQGYDDFQAARAVTAGTLRPVLAADAKSLTINLTPLAAGSKPILASAFAFNGSADFSVGPGGYAGSLLLQANPYTPGGSIVVTGPDSTTERNAALTTVAASALNAVGAPSLYIGARPTSTENSSSLAFDLNYKAIQVETGAVLRGAQVALSSRNLITLDSGARIDTLGQQAKLIDSSAGYLFGSDPSAYPVSSVLIASNGYIELNTPSGAGNGGIVIADGASIYSEGTIGFFADKGVTFEGTPQLGTRNLVLSLPSINIGEAGALVQAMGIGALPVGINLDQGLLDRLLAGNKVIGIPAIESLVLGATKSINFYGSVDLNLMDASTGAPLLQQLVLNTPAIYGHGDAADTARLTVDTLVWNGKASPIAVNGILSYESAKPGAVIAGGPGTGLGTFDINARQIVFGYSERSQPITELTFNRLMLGFSGVNLNASDRITANNKGSLSVYAAAGADPSAGFDPATYAGTGGRLNLVTPLLTGDAGSIMSYHAGGALTVAAPAGAAPNTTTRSALGAEINLHAGTIDVSTPIVLPSGKLTMTAVNDITLMDGARLDLSGKAIPFFDVTQYSWGGDVDLESTYGNIVQAAGSVIDLSAKGADAGVLKLTATGANAGYVSLGGTLHGQGGAGHAGGSIDLRAQRIGANADNLGSDFAALNTVLNAEGFDQARAFNFKQGNLSVGDEVRARQVDISVDGGSLAVNGRIDASGARPGTIRLAARDDLTLSAGAVLDAHGTQLQVDSYGQAIEAKNRGLIELTAAQGWLRLEGGTTLNLSSPDGVARGKVELNAGRTSETSGDIRLDARAPVNVQGAASIAANGFWSYSPTDADGTIVQNNGGLAPVSTVDGSVGLDQIDQRSQQFMTAALVNGDLQNRLAGLSTYGGSFHLRPGVEINSSGTPTGNLTVTGDLDLSGYRYGLNADRNLASVTYGAGEVGKLIVRAAGNLTINGSINDGFGPKPENPPGYIDLIDITTDSRFPLSTPGWGGAPGYSSLGLDSNVYLTTDWTIPNTPFYEDWAANMGFYDGETFSRYFPGDLLPAGTQLYAGGGYLGFEQGLPMPGLAVGLTAGIPAQAATSPAAAMLAAGSQSWSMRLGSGADLAGSDTRALRALSTLAGSGNTSMGSTGSPNFRVIRTGTGDLELLVGGNFSQDSLYGIYTAGTQAPLAADNSSYDGRGSYYPDHGGNLSVSAQGSLTSMTGNSLVSEWLWRQGSNEDGIKTAWSINFGSYVAESGATALHGFTGFGALGGGNVTLLAGKDAGNMVPASWGDASKALVVAVGATGRVTSVTTSEGGGITGGTLSQTGGGDINIKIGGRLNAGASLADSDDANGVLTNLRGDTVVQAGAIGALPLQYGRNEIGDPRAVDPYTAMALAQSGATGGPVVVPGDGRVMLRTRGDLVLGGAGDAGQQRQLTTYGGVDSWFTLWQPTTAIDMFSAGGNLTPNNTWLGNGNDNWVDDGGFLLHMMPAALHATAASGSIYYGGNGAEGVTIKLAPSPVGQLELLAQRSVYGAAYTLSSGFTAAAHLAMSGAKADPDSLPNPFKPAHVGNATQRNLGSGFFVFQTDNASSSLHENDSDPMRIYAVDGDLVNVVLGEQRDAWTNGISVPGYVAAKAAHVRAGRDIVGFGNGYSPVADASVSSLLLNVNATDVSLISAGRDMFHTNVRIAGPGTLEVSAGRNLYQGNDGIITSIGPIVEGDAHPGASIVMQAGVGPDGPDFAAIASRYLNPANLADASLPLADQPGKVAKTYGDELVAWLTARYGYTGTAGDALNYFYALAPAQRNIFLRQVYYAELKAGGREYNDTNSKRYGSYLRGRDMIAALFPDQDAADKVIKRSGDITMFGGSGVRTLFGGDIQMLAPGGQIVVGVQGAVPPSTSGIVTQGDGDIQLFSEGSLLLGLSRVMTTFGGNILAWSEEGDINAGRGSKTTLVYTPPKRVYDAYGNVKLSPDVPSSGAGIATLNPIAEVQPGDIDLIAPLGTIDAGEAGIRVSGNVNLAALQVVNAANIQVQGESIGIPVMAAVNVAALTNASAAASQASVAAQDVIQRERASARQNLPSIFTVRVLGFGNEPMEGVVDTPPRGGARAEPVSYNPNSSVVVLGLGGPGETQRAHLTRQEQKDLGM